MRILIGRGDSVEDSLSNIMNELNTEIEEIEISFKGDLPQICHK